MEDIIFFFTVGGCRGSGNQVAGFILNGGFVSGNVVGLLDISRASACSDFPMVEAFT